MVWLAGIKTRRQRATWLKRFHYCLMSLPFVSTFLWVLKARAVGHWQIWHDEGSRKMSNPGAVIRNAGRATFFFFFFFAELLIGGHQWLLWVGLRDIPCCLWSWKLWRKINIFLIGIWFASWFLFLYSKPNYKSPDCSFYILLCFPSLWSAGRTYGLQ